MDHLDAQQSSASAAASSPFSVNHLSEHQRMSSNVLASSITSTRNSVVLNEPCKPVPSGSRPSTVRRSTTKMPDRTQSNVNRSRVHLSKQDVCKAIAFKSTSGPSTCSKAIPFKATALAVMPAPAVHQSPVAHDTPIKHRIKSNKSLPKTVQIKVDPKTTRRDKKSPKGQQTPCSAHMQKFLARCGFIIGKQLNSGSFARVFRGKYKATDAAVKIVDLATSADEFRNKFFPRELYALRMLTHPHIINTYDVLAAEGRIFIFMELAERGDILDYVRIHGAIAEWKAKIWFKQVCLALEYMHRNGFAHRDLKPENILLDNRLNAKLTDFGFSRICFDFEHQTPMYSETYCGSSAYVAPEVLREEPYNAMLSDVWSLGVVLYVMLNDALPFDDSNLHRMMKKQMKRKYSFVRNARLSDGAQSIIKSMLEPDLNRRTHVNRLYKHAWLQNVPEHIPANEN